MSLVSLNKPSFNPRETPIQSTAGDRHPFLHAPWQVHSNPSLSLFSCTPRTLLGVCAYLVLTATFEVLSHYPLTTLPDSKCDTTGFGHMQSYTNQLLSSHRLVYNSRALQGPPDVWHWWEFDRTQAVTRAHQKTSSQEPWDSNPRRYLLSDQTTFRCQDSCSTH